MLLGEFTPKTMFDFANLTSLRSAQIGEIQRVAYLRTPLLTSIPEHFSDLEMLSMILNCETEEEQAQAQYWSNISCTLNFCNDKYEKINHRYLLTCGLLIKLKKGLLRIIKKSKLKRPYNNDLFYSVVKYNTYDICELQNWNADDLAISTTELCKKSVCLSSELRNELGLMELLNLKLNKDTMMLEFPVSFLDKVAVYHSTVSRPPGTFISLESNSGYVSTDTKNGSCSHGDKIARKEEDTKEQALLQFLSNLPREKCTNCGANRQVYCGDCGGLRLPSTASKYLPHRINLPFDVLLFHHWYVPFSYHL
jgi:hypothetical protein